MHWAIGGVTHEHSKQGSEVLILSPTFNVNLPNLQVCGDAAPLPASETSLSIAAQGIKPIKIQYRKIN